ncbi:hypothetical protein BT96DRAFT_499193 [Gymnopus androsaceus JB14]|uniref:Uncharacterized protein n=1 Tax=Gymnopus androsaceus JB14 TaxID=1447944 RepID=A0A6A4HYV8_9AGAR|nr:hypothetical protein BT96DRAFT_499193 [Gymnopus androsaceus JB14]
MSVMETSDRQSTSSGSTDYYRPDIHDEIHASEFPFPPLSTRKESKPRRSSSHSRHSSHSISALLIMTNERLTLANARNATLETQKEELLLRFASLVKDKASVEAELRATQESLRLHRVQLEVAQREVNRATEVVRGVDKARVEAENEAARLRSKLRQLEEEKVTRQGWEEGWDIGFHEGIERAQAESGLMDRFIRRRRGSSTRRRADSRDGETDGDENGADDSTVSTPVRRTRSSSTRSRKTSVPDAGPYVPPLPIPTVTTPIPLDIPNTQPQQPVSRPPSAGRFRERVRSLTSRSTPRSPSSSGHHPPTHQRSQSRSSRTHVNVPEPSQNSSPEVIHPLPTPSRPPLSPTMSHRSTILPDNYIPMLDKEDNFIPMPPPHELSMPVPSATPAPSEPEMVRERREMRENRRSRAISNVSRASTRISEYDLVSPPAHEGSGEGSRGPYFSGIHRERSPTPGPGSRRMVEEWRNIMSPSPPGRIENEGIVNGVPSEAPPRMQSPTTGRRSRSPRVSGGPRQRKPIVMPKPLSVLQNDPQSSSNIQRIQAEADRASEHPITPPRYYRTEQLQQEAYTHSGPSTANDTPTESSPPAGTARTKTPMAWLRKHFQRSYSSPVVPNIEIEPPSQTPTNTSSGNSSTRMNPVLLTPEDANRPALPNDIISEATRGISILPSSTPLPHSPITIQLPDEELPLGFVPMTPVMAYSSPRGAEHYYEDSGSMFSPIPDNY